MMKLKAIMFKEYPEVFYRFHPIHFVRATVEVTKKGIFHSTEQTQTLYSSAKKACPEFKQTDKFLNYLDGRLKEVLADKEVELLSEKGLYKRISNNRFVEVPQVKEDKPNTFLNDTSTSKRLSYVERVRVESSWVKAGVRIG